MTRSPFGAGTTFDLYQEHKSLGFAALALTLLRIVARAASAAPARVSGWEGLLSRAVQAAFYVLTLAAIAAGWLVVSASPLPVPTQFFGSFVIPNIAPPDATLFASRRSRPPDRGLRDRRARRAACRGRAEAPLDRPGRYAQTHAAEAGNR